MNYSAIDLFCGCGGFSLGLERAGFDVLFGVDHWEVAKKTYDLNFSHPALKLDLSKITASELHKKAGIEKKLIF